MQVLRGGVDMGIPCVPDVVQLGGGAWVEGSGQIVAGSGLVRALRTSGGGACSTHAMFGKPGPSRALFFSESAFVHEKWIADRV